MSGLVVVLLGLRGGPAPGADARAVRRERALAALGWRRAHGPASAPALGSVTASLPRWSPPVVAAGFAVRGPVAGIAVAGCDVGRSARAHVRRRASQAALPSATNNSPTPSVRSPPRCAPACRCRRPSRSPRGRGDPPLRATALGDGSSLELGSRSMTRSIGGSHEVGTDDARLVAGVLRLHRRSGGDLPATLDQVAATLRERHAAAGEVRALTAQARLSGTILGVLPIGFFAFLWITSRERDRGRVPLARPASARSASGSCSRRSPSCGSGISWRSDERAVVAALPCWRSLRPSWRAWVLARSSTEAPGIDCPLRRRWSPSPIAPARRSVPRAGWIAVSACVVVLTALFAAVPASPAGRSGSPASATGCATSSRTAGLARRARAVDAEIPQLLDLLAAGSSAGLAAPLALPPCCRRAAWTRSPTRSVVPPRRSTSALGGARSCGR